MEKADWKEYLKLDRWDDLRLAVAEFKKINPVEFVFLSFVHEGRFDTRRSGWQFDLVLGSTWAEMIKIADTAVKISDLSYECEDERVSGDVVIRDVFRQGIELNIALKQQETELIRKGEIRHPRNPDDSIDLDSYLDPDHQNPLWN
jgi:hypothetical protein